MTAATTSLPDLSTTMRTHACGTLRAGDAGEHVRLGGWVHRRRLLGGIAFVDLRDRTGIVQVAASAELVEAAGHVGAESVILVEGVVELRPERDRNPELPTGDVEVRASSLRVVGPATPPAIPVFRPRGEMAPSEEQRLLHRYLDLRRPEMQHNLVLRHRLLQLSRSYLSNCGFLEIETPILTKPTPEGARDYLVPSRVHAGEFYALPQSPQLYKQLLMVAGLDRYFQIARCFRDEDLRADRQPEFTQIDVEASFVTPDDILHLTEGLLAALWEEGGAPIEPPFPRMTYADAMERFGTDRPDLRYGMELFDATPAFAGTESGIVRAAVGTGGRVRGIRVPAGAGLSRSAVDELEALAKGAGAGGLLRVRGAEGGAEGPAARFLGPDGVSRLGLAPGELALMAAGPDRVTSAALDRVRQELARRLGLVDSRATRFVWVTDFPLFERDAATGVLGAVHHPFTAPHPDDIALLASAPERVRAQAYDVVVNGTELGGGSIRISDPELQRRVFSLLGIDDDVARARFGFLLEGLRAGAPPHGGIALGMDRIAMLLAGAPSLRDVIAFPKTTAARALFEGAPARVPVAELADLHIAISKRGNE